MPSGWMRAFAAALPRLRNEETLRGLTARLATEGRAMSDWDRRAVITALTDDRQAERPMRPATLAELADVVNVVEVPVG